MKMIPVAQSYLTFKGDVTNGLEIGQAMGPTTYGGWMFVVGFDYVSEFDRTEVAMSAVMPV